MAAGKEQISFDAIIQAGKCAKLPAPAQGTSAQTYEALIYEQTARGGKMRH